MSLDIFQSMDMTPNKREAVYNTQLAPLKAKISQMLLYDSEKASIFLQEYNEIVKTGEKSGTSIISKIVDLELKIQEYEENRGNQKLYTEQSKTIVNQIEYLNANCEQMELKDFEKSFVELKEIYNINIGSYNYTDRDIIEPHFASVQAKLIIRKVQKGALDLYSEISEDDEARLTMIINNAIYNLMQNENPNIEHIVNDIKFKMMNRADAIYDPEIWKLLDMAQRDGEDIQQIEEEDQQLVQDGNSKTLLLSSILKKITLPSLGTLFKKQKSIRIGNFKMKVNKTVQIGSETIDVEDLARIDMDWLASKMPQEMLTEIEYTTLKEERKAGIEVGRRSKRYIPDSRMPIYDFVLRTRREHISEFDFYNEIGIKLHIQEKFSKFFCKSETLSKISNIISYTKLIDRITKGCLCQQLLNELREFFEKQFKDMEGKEYYDRTYQFRLEQLPILKNLAKSLSNLEDIVDETRDDFYSKERIKREAFYDQQKFRTNLIAKVDESKGRKKDDFEEWVDKMIERMEEMYY